MIVFSLIPDRVKKSISRLLLAVGAALLFIPLSADIVKLPEINKPSQLYVASDRIIVTEGAVIYIYSLKDFRLIKKFGLMGEGPNEFKLNPFGPGLRVYPKGAHFIVNSDGKISEITPEGVFLSETKVPPFSLFVPAGENYVVNASEVGENQRMWLNLNVVNGKLEKIATLHRTGSTIGTGLYSNLLFDVILLPYESLLYPVYRDNIYIPAESGDSAVIRVFDPRGVSLRSLQPVALIREKVPEDYKTAMRTWFREHSPLKQYYEQIRNSIRFRSHYPLFRNIMLDNDLIYLFTHHEEGGKSECVVLNLRGEKVNRLLLLLPVEEPFAPMCYHIQGSHLYALKGNDETEIWELHITSLK